MGIWQLNITLKNLSKICKRNAKLVDYISKRVNNKVIEWNTEKDDFKKLTWAEMDDSDIELDFDIDIPLPAPSNLGESVLSEGDQRDDKHKYDSFNAFDAEDIASPDHAVANPDPLTIPLSVAKPIATSKHISEGNHHEVFQTVAALLNVAIKHIHKKKNSSTQQKLAKRKKKLEETQKYELAQAKKEKTTTNAKNETCRN